MSITLDLQPEIEEGLLAQARARGVSLTDYVQQIIEREAHTAAVPATSAAKNLVELFENSPFKGLSMEFERDQDYGRETDL